ncbi:Hypothetical_protein [Hexamita inflata]|uniref:Hypothetical_protein n=1 Tax=Hexamita inflata TaxID=28002 RepID=A0AA86QWE4_9EUKA|nr:Hypothetical protein HINF_LOCUS46390 [Hexamita inflata]
MIILGFIIEIAFKLWKKQLDSSACILKCSIFNELLESLFNFGKRFFLFLFYLARESSHNWPGVFCFVLQDSQKFCTLCSFTLFRAKQVTVLSVAVQGQARNSTLLCLITSYLSLQEKLQRFLSTTFTGWVLFQVIGELLEPTGFGLTPSKYWLQLMYRNNNIPMNDQLLIA